MPGKLTRRRLFTDLVCVGGAAVAAGLLALGPRATGSSAGAIGALGCEGVVEGTLGGLIEALPAAWKHMQGLPRGLPRGLASCLEAAEAES